MAAARPRGTGASVVVPVVMLLVAAIGTWRHHALDQTSWRGASVGMFARVDAPANRLVRGVVEVPRTEGGGTGRVLRHPPRELSSTAERALVTPTDHNLRQLAAAWETTVDEGRLVRVEVWATRFRGSSPPAVRLELVGSHDLETTADP